MDVQSVHELQPVRFDRLNTDVQIGCDLLRIFSLGN